MLTERVNDLAENYLAPVSLGLASPYAAPTARRVSNQLYARALHKDRTEACTQVSVLIPVATEGRLEGFIRRIKKDFSYRQESTFEFFEEANASRTWLLYRASQTLGSALTFGLIGYGVAEMLQHQNTKVLLATLAAIVLGNAASYVYERVKGTRFTIGLRREIPLNQESSL